MVGLAEILGESPGIVAVRETVGRLLQRQADARRLPPVLIQGETGTGKGLVARALHRAGPRRDGPFVDVNCAAIPEPLLEAEMFGFERGAFTDARQAKPGLVQTAHKGLIFLDEVGLLPSGLQSKLLKFVEDRTVRRLGSTRSEPVDVWIITASNEDLGAAARQGGFREDLYHRLAVVTLWLPPLRERGDDIAVLAEHFLDRISRDYGLPPKSLAPDGRGALLAHPWPGNVRELSNVIERVALLEEAPLITREMLGLREPTAMETPQSADGEEAVPFKEELEGIERERLLQALRRAKWNIVRAAASLGIPRGTLRYRIEKYGLERGGALRTSRRRRAQPTVSEGPVTSAGADVEATPEPTHWEVRRLALLRAALVVRKASDALYTSRALEVIAEKTGSFGGRIQERGPTGIVAAFGLEPVEDAPRRSAHAAIAMQKAAERARRDDVERPGLKVAIHMAECLVRETGRRSEIDLETKHRAWGVLEALVSDAEPDAILVSETAAPLLERRFDLVPLAGRGGGRPAFRLVGPERPGLEIGRRMSTFVGRRQDLELLESRLALALRGHGQVVGVVGEAGIGKSRLLYELRRRVGNKPVAYLAGRCVSYGAGIPYLPVLDILRQHFGLIETAGSDAIRERVRLGLNAVGMNAEQASPYLLHLWGVKDGTERLAALDPEAIKLRTLETLSGLVLRISHARPLILAVEDLHCIDRASEDLLTALVADLPGTPTMFLASYRPGYRPPWIDKSFATQVALEPLSREQSLTLARSVFETDVPESLVGSILDKAEGNPFFLEELCHVARDRSESLAVPAVPDTVQEVLLARIHRLPDEPKRVLQAASIVGREVPGHLLRAILDAPGDPETHLRELTRQEFLYARPGVEESLYIFKHPLTQEVVYESVADARRKTLHTKAAKALEEMYVDRLEAAYDRLAYHYAKTDEADRAVEYLTRFAEQAAGRFAHVEAAAALREALAHVERLPAEIRERRLYELVLRQNVSLFFIGCFRENLDLLLRHQERVERLGDPTLTGPFFYHLATAYYMLGDHAPAVAHARRALDDASRSGDEATMGKAHFVLAYEAFWSGQPWDGVAHGRSAVTLLEPNDERWSLGFAHWIVGMNYALMGDFEAALSAQARAHAIAEAAHPRLLGLTMWSTGLIHSSIGECEAGIDACRRSLEVSRDPVNLASASGALGFAYLEQGDPARAIPLLERSVEELRKFGSRDSSGWFATFLGEAYLVSGQIERAQDLAVQGTQVTGDARYRFGLGWAQRTLGRIAYARGLHTDAAERLDEALQTFGSMRARFEMARTRLELARVRHAQGNADAAATDLGAAHQLFRSLGVPKYVERSEQLARQLQVSLPA